MKLRSTPRQFTLSPEVSLEGSVASPPPIVCSHSQKPCILSPLFATLTHSASRKSFPCHSYENTRDIRHRSEPQAKLAPTSLSGQGLIYPELRRVPSRPQHDHAVNREGPRSGPDSPLSPLDSTLTRNAPSHPNPQETTPLESIPNSTKSFRSHSYEKCASKSSISHSYKIIRLKVPPNHTLTKRGWGGGPRC
jgi:hypothetical protein